METTTDALATPIEMAALYQVSRETMYRYLAQGLVPGSFKIGGAWRVSLPVWRAAMESVGEPQPAA